MHFIIKFPFLCLLLLVKNEENCQIDVCLHTHTRPRAFAICTVNSPSCFQDREVAPTEPLRSLNRKIYDIVLFGKF